MAQTADAMSGANCAIEVTTDGSTFTDISGSASSIEPGEQARLHGVVYTFSGDTAVITSGKREPMELVVKIVYTETSGEAFETVRAAFEAGTKIGVRWSPAGGLTADARYTSDLGVITAFSYPPSDAGDGAPIAAGFKVKVPKVTRALIA